MGHENISTTAKYYMLDNPEHTHPVTDKLIEGIYGKRDDNEPEKQDDEDDYSENSAISK